MGKTKMYWKSKVEYKGEERTEKLGNYLNLCIYQIHIEALGSSCLIWHLKLVLGFSKLEFIYKN